MAAHREDLHPRDNAGRFAAKPRPAPTRPATTTAAAAAAAEHDETPLARAARLWSGLVDRDHPDIAPLRDAVRTNPSPAPTLYRGFVTTPDQPQPEDLVPGSTITLPFVSCSEEETVAEEFSWDEHLDENDPGLLSVVVELQGAQGVDISKHSLFPDQGEWVVEGTATITQVARHDDTVHITATFNPR